MNAVVETKPLLRLDLGCGKNKREGFTGVDRREFPGVDQVVNLAEQRDYHGSSLGFKPWPWEDSSVEEVHMSHTLEHFTGVERVHIFNELWRVLIPGGKAAIVTPHWSSNRAYGDFTHAWPPVSEMLYYYISKTWRAANAPDNDAEWNPQGYTCDFDATWGYGMRQDLLVRNQEYQMFAMANYKEACADLHATVIAKK